MLKGQDIVILLKLLAHPEEKWNMLRLSKALKMNYSTLHQAVERLRFARLVGQSFEDGRLVFYKQGVVEILLHSVRYFFPAREGALTTGIPTGYAAPVFAEIFVQGSPTPPVLPYEHGVVQGCVVEPLVKNAGLLATEDPELYGYLAIADAIRSGGAREVLNAKKLLQEKTQ